MANFTGDGGNNTLTGGGQNDTITGNGGADTMSGGGGADTFVFNTGDVVAGESIDGGAGSDKLSIASGALVNFTPASILSIEGITFNNAGGGTAIFDASQIATGKISTSAVITGSTGTDSITINNATNLNLSGWTFNGSAFENLTINGSNGSDTIVGSIKGDTIHGGTGNDNLTGLAGNDTLDGGGDIDTANYSAASALTVHLDTVTQTVDGTNVGHDTLISIENILGGSNADIIFANGSDGTNNVFNGGGGNDTVNYSAATNPLTIDLTLATPTATGIGIGTDQLLSIEHVTGGSGDDTFIASVTGGVSNTLNGGPSGSDTVSYAASTNNLTVNLRTGSVSGTGIGPDNLVSIENVTTGSGTDTFLANVTDNASNAFNGGANTDTLDYSTATNGLVVNFAAAFASGVGIGSDTLTSIEIVKTGSGADTFVASAIDNSNTTFNGGGGTDTADYSESANNLTINLLAGTATGAGIGTDTLTFIENAVGGSGGDTITGNNGVNRLTGGAGTDGINGGGGVDTIDYSLEGGSQGVSVNLVTGAAADTFGDADTLSNIENISGSSFDDTFVVPITSANNTFAGNNGTDTIDYSAATGNLTVNLQTGTASGGGVGTDSLISIENVTTGSGRDTITAAASGSVIQAGANNDTIVSGTGDDTFIWAAGDGIDTVNATADVGGSDVIFIPGTFYDFNWQVAPNQHDLYVGVTADDSYTFNGYLVLKDFMVGKDSIAYLETDLGALNEKYYSNPDNTNARIYINAITGGNQGDGYEYIFGTDSSEVMTGGGGRDDDIWGFGGGDQMSVTGNTIGHFHGGSGDDIITGADANDRMRGDDGNDELHGGAGFDTARYGGGSPTGAFVNLSDDPQDKIYNGVLTHLEAHSALDGYGTEDTLDSIEWVEGSQFADVMIGSTDDNKFTGFAGDDDLDGGLGSDTARYNNSPNGVIVDLQGGTAVDGWGYTDTLTSIESAEGSNFADVMVGSDDANTFTGFGGDDNLTGGAGVDTYVWSAGDGVDTIYADGSQSTSEDVILINGTFYDYHWEREGSDLLIGVTADDSYTFNAGGSLRLHDFFAGGDSIAYLETDLGAFNQAYYSNPDNGNARIYLSAINGGDQGDSFEVILGTDDAEIMTSGGGRDDSFWGEGGSDEMSVTGDTLGRFHGGSGDDIITGANNDDRMRGDDGNDELHGGAGFDTARYGGGAPTGAFVNLSDDAQDKVYNGVLTHIEAHQAFDGYTDESSVPFVDTLDSIESVEGSKFDDVMVGSTDNNKFTGFAGSDTFVFAPGGGSDEVMDFQAGAGADALDLVAYGFVDDTEAKDFAADDGDDVVFSFETGDSLRLHNVHVADLTDDNILT